MPYTKSVGHLQVQNMYDPSLESPFSGPALYVGGGYSPSSSSSTAEASYTSIGRERSEHASPRNCIMSPRGLFRIFGHYTLQGEVGMPISVTLNFNHRSGETIFLRFVLGRKALTTSVRRSTDTRYGSWELEAIVPAEHASMTASTPIPLSVQALSSVNEVFDSVVVGNFTYWNSPSQPSHPPPHNSVFKRDSSEDLFLLAAFDVSSLSSSSSRPRRTAPSRSSSSRSRSGKSTRDIRPKKKQTIMRTRRFPPGEDLADSHRVILELLNPLESMSLNWEEEEKSSGRRLIRFHAKQESLRLKVSAEVIKQGEYVEGDAVVSCIYRKDNNSCYVTSVDIISLLEKLVDGGFEIEEKNRIRRNLEGFRPKTVSKNRRGSEQLFQQIMDFPIPRPRNIEKDVKVFDWNILPQALDKIISKYSFYPQHADGVEFDLQTFHSSSYGQSSSSPTSEAMSIPRSDTPSIRIDHLHTPDVQVGGSYIIHPEMPFISRSETAGSYDSLLGSPPSETSTPRSHTSADGHYDPSSFSSEFQQSLYHGMPMSQSPPMPTPGPNGAYQTGEFLQFGSSPYSIAHPSVHDHLSSTHDSYF